MAKILSLSLRALWKIDYVTNIVQINKQINCCKYGFKTAIIIQEDLHANLAFKLSDQVHILYPNGYTLTIIWKHFSFRHILTRCPTSLVIW